MAILEVIPDKLAVILVDSRRKKVSSAFPVLLMGIFEFVESHLTDVVKTCVLPSVKVPVALNCAELLPLERETETEAGSTVIDTNTAEVIVKTALFDVIPEKLAVMVVVPSALDVASPFEPDVLLIVATPVFEEFQVTNDDKSCLELSVNVPMAMNCWVCPRARLWFAGVTSIDFNTSRVTVSVAEDEGTESIVAVIVAVPISTAVASPFEPVASLTVAIAVLDVAQVTNDVTSCVLQLPVNVPMAVNCCVVPLAILVPVGDVTTDATADEVSVVEPVFKS